MRRPLLVASFVVFLTGCGAPARPAPPPVRAVATAQPPSLPVDELDEPLPLDARVTRGQLENGLTYYILPHKKPENRAHVWLAVNAGSVLEDEQQRGLAHFVEHMAFNGTQRFPKQSLVDFLEKSGVRFGADLNAYTSFDETVYMLQVPTDKAELFGKSFSVLRDWADGVSFDPQEVEKERAVVLEEWRLGRGAGMRLFDKQAPVVFYGSKYPERLPIGKPEIIQHAPREALLSYYRDWYRPELMAVIAVGDFRKEDVEARIRAEFASLRAPARPRPRPRVEVPAHPNTLVTIETDPEMPTASVALLSKLPHRPELSSRDYRRKISERLFNDMLNERLDELRRKPNAPFLSAGSAMGGLVRATDVLRQSVTVKDDAALSGFGALLEEIHRVERHGFTQTEFDRAKSQLLRQFQHAVGEREKLDGRALATEIVRNFLQRETMPGAEAELALVEKFLPGITLTELEQLGKTMSAGSHVIAVTGPSQMQKPSAEALLALSSQVAARDIAAYADNGADLRLMTEPPKAGSVVKVSDIAELGVSEWTLSNGVKVVLKPTNFANDEIQMSAFSPGGTSLVRDADFDSARFADRVVDAGGIGPFDSVALRKALAGKLVSVSARIDELEEKVSGRATKSDLELMFQLIHLSFTAPRRDADAFASWRARATERASHRLLSPEQTFSEEMQAFSTQNHLRRRPSTPEVLSRVDLDKALAIYKDRFADASDFTFVFVGNFTKEQLKPLVETYLGSLPAKQRKESWRDVHVSWPTGVKQKTVFKGSEPKSLVVLSFHGQARWSRDADNDFRSLGDALRIRLREVLREDLGGVYGVQVSGNISRRPRQEYMLSVSFGCLPDNVEKLKKAAFDEIASLKERGIDEGTLTKIVQTRRRAQESDLMENRFWLHELGRAYTFGDDPKLILELEPLLSKVSSERVRGAAKQYLSTKQYVLGVLSPETAGTTSPSATPPALTPANSANGGLTFRPRPGR
jgi:zinc protease